MGPTITRRARLSEGTTGKGSELRKKKNRMGEQRLTGYPLLDAVIGDPDTGGRVDGLLAELEREKRLDVALRRVMDLAVEIAESRGIDRERFLSEVAAAAQRGASAVWEEVERRREG